MAVSPKSVDMDLVRKLIPLDTLALPKIEEILDKSVLQKVPAGRVIFKQGDNDKWTVYLLTGEIELSSSDGPSEIIKVSSNAGLKPLSKGTPRRQTATAKTEVTVLIIDTQLFNILLNFNTPSSIEVTSFGSDPGDDEGADWMSQFLQSGAFIQLSATNMQALLMKLEDVPLKKGKIVIKEGDIEDQNYYIIKQGQCIVSRLDRKTGRQKPLAILKTGLGFGEEALITGTARGASVSMKNNGVVMKLDKKDFIDLLVKPLIQIIDKSELSNSTEEEFKYVDVRSKIEYETNGIKDSIHCPIRSVRDQIPQLDPDTHYIIYSNSENRASSVAFLFIQQDLEVSVLREGVGKPDLTEEQIQTSLESEEKKVPIKNGAHKAEITENSAATQSTNNTAQSDPNTSGEHDINHYIKLLKSSESSRIESEKTISHFAAKLAKYKELAAKDTKLAKNAIALLKKSEIKIKALEQQLKNKG